MAYKKNLKYSFVWFLHFECLKGLGATRSIYFLESKFSLPRWVLCCWCLEPSYSSAKCGQEGPPLPLSLLLLLCPILLCSSSCFSCSRKGRKIEGEEGEREGGGVAEREKGIVLTVLIEWKGEIWFFGLGLWYERRRWGLIFDRSSSHGMAPSFSSSDASSLSKCTSNKYFSFGLGLGCQTTGF